MSQLTRNQINTLEATERVASVLSFLGCSFVFLTFIFSTEFRKPFNRLIFYATWGNLLANVATVLAQAGIKAGASSTLCQLQGFLVQFSMPVDFLMNLMMAINVYLTIFKKYNARDLKKLERRYLLITYGGPLLIAFIYCFLHTPSRGKVYGPAILWCWVSPGWDFLRIATFYGPAWVCIVISSTIYAMAGREIFRKRQELRSFQKEAELRVSNLSYQANHVQISSEVTVTGEYLPLSSSESQNSTTKPPRPSYEAYTVSVSQGARTRPCSHSAPALAANAAAIGYTKCAVLFFLSLLVTWVPSSVNRVYSLSNPANVSWPLTFAAGLVLPLMGFWNSLIYVIVSWEAVVGLFVGLKRKGKVAGQEVA